MIFFKKNACKEINLLFSIVTIIFLSSCVRQEPLNLTIAKERVECYYECGQYDKDVSKIVKRALKHFKKVPSYKRATVIFDIDDTVLSDYADEKSISFGYVPKLSHEWILRADAPAIPETKRLYDYLVKRGFTIIFLTGRKYHEYDATIKNLSLQGFTHIDKLIVRQPDELSLTAEQFKVARRKKLSSDGYRIVGCVGDQWSDLVGGYTGYKVKLPNVRYCIR